MLALQSEYFYLEVPPAALQAALYRHGVAALSVVNEFWRRGSHPKWELNTDRFDLAELMYGGLETYASSKEDDWLIYVSHEHSITFAGAWLVDAIEQIWPAWSHRRYAGYEYTGAMLADPALLADPSPLWFLQPDDGVWP